MVYLFLATGFEEIEAVTVADVLRRAAIAVSMVSLTDSLTVRGAHGVAIVADCMLTDVDMQTASMFVLPGGMPGTKNLWQNQILSEMILRASEKRLPLAAICAAPSAFAKLGILQGCSATCYPGFEQMFEKVELIDKPLVVDGNIITANGPAAAIEFALAIVKLLSGEQAAKEVAAAMLLQ